jgi:hypothetical protein
MNSNLVEYYYIFCESLVFRLSERGHGQAKYKGHNLHGLFIIVNNIDIYIYVYISGSF